jgi:hypothetical protein
MSLDDPTQTELNSKQEALSTILFNINQMYEHATEDDILSETIYDVSLPEVYAYLRDIETDQDSPIKLLRIRYTKIHDFDTVANLYDYTQVYPEKEPPYDQRVYFIEGDDFALTLIPVEEKKGQIQIHMTALDASPDFITEMFAELDSKKSLEELGLIKASDLKPTTKKKPRP